MNVSVTAKAIKWFIGKVEWLSETDFKDLKHAELPPEEKKIFNAAIDGYKAGHRVGVKTKKIKK